MGLRGGGLGVWDCGEVDWGYGTAGRWTGGMGSGEGAVGKVCRVGYWDSGWDVPSETYVGNGTVGKRMLGMGLWGKGRLKVSVGKRTVEGEWVERICGADCGKGMREEGLGEMGAGRGL